MKNFIVNVSVFLIIVYCIDVMLSLILLVNRPNDYQEFIASKKEVHQVDDIDILILGDCFVSDAIDPNILEDLTNKKTFNLGVYVSTPFEQYFLLLEYLKHHKTKPEVILLGINSQMLTDHTNPGKYTRLIMKDKLLKWKINLNSEDKDFSVFFRSIQEKDLYSYILKYKLFNLKEYIPARKVISACNGYLEFYNTNDSIDRDYSHNDLYCRVGADFNKKQIFYLKEIITEANKENIKVIFIETPFPEKWNEIYKTTGIHKQYVDLKKDLIEAYKIPVYSYHKNNLTQSDFLNYQHLNSNGAKKLTHDLGNWIFQYLLVTY